MKWAPEATQSHLQHYQTRMDSSGLDTHSGLALATESLMHYAKLTTESNGISVSKITLFHLCFYLLEYTYKAPNWNLMFLYIILINMLVSV